ncbi:unnamed protein product [Lymnaea stagnalis]|uniref:EGF-like domain-containing protein n=1 Tax=Lymnaea stagnalis TaxID=6523 RepID=A0AAV2HRS9_LYMST
MTSWCFVLFLIATWGESKASINSTDKVCDIDEFDCGQDKHCIPHTGVCDGKQDCANGDDEAGCATVKQNITCEAGEFFCEGSSHSICIPKLHLCDGFEDCFDGGDEAECIVTCRPHQFLCRKESHCISQKHVCDGQKDCEDGADEIDCDVEMYNCGKDPNKFLCNDNSKCLLAEFACNGHKDCLDGSDEINNCYSLCAHLPCDQLCLPDSNGVKCTCHVGFQMNSTNNMTCIDIDECSLPYDNSVCSHICENSLGSYFCSCVNGYEKTNDGKCKAKGKEPEFIYSTQEEIRIFMANKNYYNVLLQHLHGINSLAVDSDGHKIFWSEFRSDHQPGVFYTDFKTSFPAKTTIMAFGLVHPRGLAYDFAEKNLYISDSEKPAILACKPEQSICVTVFNKNLVRHPTDLALNPGKGIIYWIEDVISPVIMKGSMDGSYSSVFISAHLYSPLSLFVDLTTQRLFWIDNLHNMIQSVGLDGRDRQNIIGHGISHPSMLSVFEDDVLWANTAVMNIVSANKFTGLGLKVIQQDIPPPTALVVHHSSLQPTRDVHTCWLKKCSHICLIGINDTYSCACPDGYKLDHFAKNCEKISHPPILIAAQKEEIITIPITSGLFQVKSHKLTSMKNVYLMAYLAKSNEILYTDSAEKGKVTINLLEDLDTEPRSRVVLNDVGTVESLAVDESSSLIYWVNGNKKAIQLSSFDGDRRATLTIEDIKHVGALAIDPSQGLLYVVDLSQPTVIVRCHQDGSACKTHVWERLDYPNTLAVSGHRIYWSDFNTGDIASVDSMGLNYQRHIITSTKPLSIAVHGTTLYWTELDGSFVYYHNLEINWSENKIETDKLQLTGLLVVEPYSYAVTKCSVDNGGCDQLCIPTPGSVTCLCAEGYRLHGNQTCLKADECNDHLCPDNITCIPRTLVCNKNPDCPDASDEANCSAHWTCREQQWRCNNGHCVSQQFFCDYDNDCGDWSDEQEALCPVHQCSEDQYRCSPSHCIAKHNLCDGIRDCHNGSDEANCAAKNCSEGLFSCGTYCILASWSCDGDLDCHAGEDELNCGGHCDGQFQCSDGECVHLEDVCDGAKHCVGGEDEGNCSHADGCGPHQFMCYNGDCIDKSSLCNSEPDCLSHEDESPQTCSVQCDENEFQCSSGQCVRSQSVCDGNNDCLDNSDENPVDCHEPKRGLPIVSCETGFKCLIGQCIDQADVCDGKLDCRDGSDESNCAVVCKTFNPCSQNCSESPTGPVCSCSKGFQLIDKTICEDIDECKSNNGGCSQKCYNRKGGVQCFCHDGYLLGTDRRSCKVNGSRPYLLVGTPAGVKQMSLDGRSSQLLVETQSMPIHLDFNVHTNNTYWTEFEASKSSKMALRSAKGTVLQSSGEIKGLAIDWVTGNIYISEVIGNEGSIKVFDGHQDMATLIFDSHFKPESIVVHPYKGLMFWLSSDSLIKLEHSWMDGFYRKDMFILSPSAKPVSLSIDHTAERLYWLNYLTATLESCKLDGTERFIIPRHPSLKVYSFDVFESVAYLTDQRHSTVAKLMTYHPEHGAQKFQTLSQVGPVKVIHKLKQPERPNPCLNKSCMFLCLLMPHGGRCFCKDGYHDGGNTRCLGQKVDDTQTVGTKSTPVTDRVICSLLCQNGGECMLEGDLESCSCPVGFEGIFCQKVSVKKGNNKESSLAWLGGIMVILVGLLSILIGLVVYVRHRRRRKILVHTIRFQDPKFKLTKKDDEEGLVPEVSFGDELLEDSQRE